MKNTIKLVKVESSDTAEFLQQNNIITHRLKPKKKDDWETQSLSNADKSGMSTNQLLSSISSKLHPKNITVSTGSKYSGIQTQKVQIRVSCLDQLMVPKFSLGSDENTLDFDQLRRKAIRKKINNIVSLPSCVQNNKKICSDSNCIQKQRWKNKLIIQPRDLIETQKLKNYVLNKKDHSPEDHQIDKDVTRSFPDRFLPKTKLTLYHASSQKMNIIQSLRTVLKMLSICDGDVAYVQGMNLYTGVIVSHIKQIQLSFLFVKQVMKYGNMRKMYVCNFKEMKESCNHLLHRHIKILMNDLYEALMEDGVSYQFFMPFYLSMFACVVDYSMMHCIIDEFMTKGFLFLDKLMLSMLCYMKKQLLESSHGEIMCKLGASFIRSLQIPWDEIINLTQTFELN